MTLKSFLKLLKTEDKKDEKYLDICYMSDSKVILYAHVNLLKMKEENYKKALSSKVISFDFGFDTIKVITDMALY